MKNVFTLGNGFIANHLPYSKILDRIIPSDKQIKSILEHYRPDVIINTLGRCGEKNIDDLESRKAETYTANVIIPSILASECQKLNIKLIHIGSGCIFYGKSPNEIKDPKFSRIIIGDQPIIDTGWNEKNYALPESFYSKTKYACDLIIGEMKNVNILRIRMPISSLNNNRNFLNKILNYKQVIDIPNSMTFCDDLVKCIDFFVKNDHQGIFNVANEMPLSPAQIVREYQKYNPSHNFEVITEKELDKLTLAKRSNCLLDISKLKSTGFQMSDSLDMLGSTMKKFVENFKF